MTWVERTRVRWVPGMGRGADETYNRDRDGSATLNHEEHQGLIALVAFTRRVRIIWTRELLSGV